MAKTIMVKVRYNVSYPIGKGEWHNYDKEQTVDVKEFTTSAITKALKESDSHNVSILSCNPVVY